MERNERTRDGLARLLLERVRDHAMMALDDDGRVTEWNAGAERLLGWSEQDALGRRMTELCGAVDDTDAAALDAARSAGEHEVVGWRRRAGGAPFWAQTQVLRYGAGDGDVGFAVLLRDLSERREAEQALAERERRLDEAQHVARLGSWEWSVATGELQWSRALYEIYGEDPTTFGPSYEAFLDRLVPEERPGVMAQVTRALEQGTDFAWQERIRRPDGRVRVLQTRGEAVRDEGGHVARLVGTCLDVTEQEASEQRERELVRAQAAREAAETMVAEKAELLRDLEESHEQLEQQAAELEAQTEELSQLMAELEVRNTEMEEVNAALRTSTAAAQEARAVAEQANAAKSQFLATMSHELRTPLNAIAGHTQLIEMGIHGPTTAAQLGALERIQRSQRHLLALINDILNFAKLEAGTVRFRTGTVNLTQAVGELIGLISPQIEASGLHCVQPAMLTEVLAAADPDKVDQILINLLSNAIKFTPSGGRIAVESEAGAASVRVHVSDTGCGVPEDKVEDIFEPFVQLRRGTDSIAEGVGLGLSISRELARAMGGELRVANLPHGGARFTLELPRAQHIEPEAHIRV
ncbi:MAG: PAS domain-containing sensor histidine kinase [Longimicrobiales bacterium]